MVCGWCSNLLEVVAVEHTGKKRESFSAVLKGEKVAMEMGCVDMKAWVGSYVVDIS